MKFSLFENYKTKDTESLLRELESSANGLSENEARARALIFGRNQISETKKSHALLDLLRHFKDPMVLILIFASIISSFAGETKNAVIIISMVFISVALNFYQEYRSNKAAEKLVKKLALMATVTRDGAKKEIPARYIVPGDIIFLAAGDIAPADGRLIKADDFFINEAALTGESFPVEKNEISKAENGQIIFSGTNVISGSAIYVAARTGFNTEFGKIAEKMERPEEANAFEIGVKNFGYLIIKVTIFIVLVIFLINAFLKHNYFESFIFSIAVAVGLTPELLPVILSVNMARGAVKMSKKGVIVKRLNAVPDFGSMDILCTDKTGTLTEDKITMVKYVDVFGEVSEEVLRQAFINGYFETGLKSPLEKAILDFRHINVSKVRKIDEIPYDFLRKRLSVIVGEENGVLMVTKGAPEEIFKISSSYKKGNKIIKIENSDRAKFKKLYDDYSSGGFRVLAVAIRTEIEEKKSYPTSDEQDMILTGFVAFYDPPKKDVKETVEFMKGHGIEIKIITGDSPLVTKKICDEIEMEVKGIINGNEIDVLGDDALGVKASEANIFARFSPAQKNRLISVLKQRGFVVGYLGDGINDAPPLKSADVGISVNNAVDVAKETADIILLKKGLRELMDGVIEGRKIFGNTMKYMMMGLGSNFGNMFSLIGAALFLPFLPMLPAQILLNNFLYDFSQFAIPLDNVDKEYLMKPKHWNIVFIRDFMYIFGPISSIFDFLTFFLLFGVFGLHNAAFQTGWFIESLATQVFVIYIVRTRQIPFLQSRPSKYLVFSTIAVVLAGIIFATTPAGSYFGFEPLSLQVLGFIFVLVIIYLLIVEIAKHFFYKRFKI